MGHDLRDLFGDWEPGLPGMPDRGSLPEEADETRRRKVVLREVRVVGVFEHRGRGSRAGKTFVLLEDKGHRRVPIWIGEFEAYAIASADAGQKDRPGTHDLLCQVLERLGGKVVRICVDDLWQETFYAKVTVSRDGSEHDIDCRPSDAIAIAVRTRAPVYVAESVFEAVGAEE